MLFAYHYYFPPLFLYSLGGVLGVAGLFSQRVRIVWVDLNQKRAQGVGVYNKSEKELIDMGACMTMPPKQGQTAKTLPCSQVANERCLASHAMNSSETHLLRLMFQDLIARSGTQKVLKDDFDVFFNLNGLWREEVFSYFDRNHQNQLSFDDLKTGLEKLVKGSLKQRVSALFSFYDINRTNSIHYSEIVSMMFSYPKSELKKIIDDEKFISTLDARERQYHFGRSCSNEEKEVVEEYDADTNSQKSGENSKAKQEERRSYRSIKSCGGEERPKTLSHSSGSISYFDTLSKRNVKIASNVSLMVRKYVDFLFNELQLDKETDSMGEEQFTYLISKHQQIFNSYYQGFHNYIWEANENRIPLNKEIPAWISSPCCSYNPKTREFTQIYMKYIKSTLFIYRQEKDNLPIEIINLEGLQLEEITKEEKLGFLLKHFNGIYPEKEYFFENSDQFTAWMKHLGHLKGVSFYEKYRLIEKIGEGNFSTVYKGIDKLSGGEVAIKIMEKKQLSSIQKYIIRHECEVLELCHHPCIVQFKEKIESKTHIYLITELLSSGDLYDYIVAKKRLSENEACFIMRELLQTTQYLHTVGLIHRDIKPENVIIRKNGNSISRVKLIDFGFAVFNNSLDSLAQCQKFAGTPGYSAPEIIKLEAYDGSVDLFSLGVLLHFMLSGELPFDGHHNDDIKRRTIKGVVQMKGMGWEKVSENAKDLVRMLLKPHSERLTVEEALDHIWIQSEEERSAAGVRENQSTNL